MGIPCSCSVSQEEYGADDDDETSTDDGCYWSGLVILCLQRDDGSASRRRVRSAHAFIASRRMVSTSFFRDVEDIVQSVEDRGEGCNARREVDANA